MTGPGVWVATVWADRDYHELLLARQDPGQPAAVGPGDFPAGLGPREVVLSTEEVRIGRAEGADGGDVGALEIDLSGPPRDPGVSHLHAVLLALHAERWVVLDAGSTNGTTVNYAEEPLARHTPQPLEAGDHVHVGAWTTITVNRRPAGSSEG